MRQTYPHGPAGGVATRTGMHDFVRDEGGAVVKDYALAIVAAAVLVIVGMTMMADALYQAYLRVFGP